MEPIPQPAPGYYVWSPPDSPIVVQIQLDAVDRLAAEVMRGFGLVPKRGAEVGGLLIGTVEPGAPTIVRIDDFELVPCEYKRGPSYLFTEEEAPRFEAALDRWEREPSRSKYAVGYIRSDTRESMRLAAEDTELLDALFPSATAVALLVKPYATKVSTAGFFVREFGSFSVETKLEFPFRRRELSGEAMPPRRSLQERRPRNRGPRDVTEISGPTVDLAAEMDVPSGGDVNVPDSGFPEPTSVPGPNLRPQRTAGSPPLSLLFLLVGLVLGFLAAVAFYRPLSSLQASELSLGLEASRTGDNITVRWNGAAGPIRNAQKGELHINDGGATPAPVLMGRAELQTGSVVYQNSSQAVEFRLYVYVDDRVSVSEAAVWRQ